MISSISKKGRFVLLGLTGGLVVGGAVFFFGQSSSPKGSVAAGVTAQSAEEQASDPGLLFAQGEERLAGGDLAGARAAFAQVVEVEPENAAAYLRIAQLEARSGAFDAALTAIAAAGEHRPQCQVTALALAEVQLERGELELAEAALSQVATPSPQRTLLQARLALGWGDVEAGLAHMEQALRALPDDARAHDAAGRSALAAGQADEARVYFARVVELDGSYEARVRYAEAIAACDRIVYEEELLAQLAAARELAPERPEAFAQLASHHLALNETDAAAAVIEQGRQACGDAFEAALERTQQG